MDDNVYNQCLRCVCVCVCGSAISMDNSNNDVCVCRLYESSSSTSSSTWGEGGVINTTFVYMYVCSSCCFSCLGIIDVCV